MDKRKEQALLHILHNVDYYMDTDQREETIDSLIELVGVEIVTELQLQHGYLMNSKSYDYLLDKVRGKGHTKQDKMDALLVSAQKIQRQCKFAQVYIENYPLHGGFNVVVFDDDNDYKKFYFGGSMSPDKLDEEFVKLEEAATYIEDVVKRHNEYNNEMFNLSLESE